MNLKILKYLIVFIGGALIGGYLVMSFSDSKEKEHIRISHSVILEKVEKMGNLEVMKYNMQDIIEYHKIREWLPNAKTALLVSGEVIATVNLTGIEREDILIFSDSIVLYLPKPEIGQIKINHSESKLYNMKYGLWESAELMDEAYKHAEIEFLNQALKINLARESLENTRNALVPMMSAMGYNHVTILFKEDLQFKQH